MQLRVRETGDAWQWRAGGGGFYGARETSESLPVMGVGNDSELGAWWKGSGFFAIGNRLLAHINEGDPARPDRMILLFLIIYRLY